MTQFYTTLNDTKIRRKHTELVDVCIGSFILNKSSINHRNLLKNEKKYSRSDHTPYTVNYQGLVDYYSVLESLGQLYFFLALNFQVNQVENGRRFLIMVNDNVLITNETNSIYRTELLLIYKTKNKACMNLPPLLNPFIP